MKKKLKRLLLILVVLVSISMQQVNAQIEKGFYISFDTGYNIGTGKPNTAAAYILQFVDGTEPNSSTSTQEIPKINLGQGFNAGLNGGYMFNKNIGLELGINYLISDKVNTSRTSFTGDYKNNEVSAKMLQIKPTIVFRGGYEIINPYAKLGMVIGSGKMIIGSDYKDGGDVFKTTLELDEGIPIGFQGSLGILYKINNKISLFGEMDLISLSYSPEKGSYTKFEANGEDVLSSMAVQSRELEFVDSFSTDSTLPPSSNEPSKGPVVPFSFSSIGFNVGVQYHFN